MMKLTEKARLKCVYHWGFDSKTASARDFRWYDADTNKPRRRCAAAEWKELMFSLEGAEDGETGIISLNGVNVYAVYEGPQRLCDVPRSKP